MNTSMELIEKIHDLMEGYLEDYKPPVSSRPLAATRHILPPQKED